MPSFLLNISRRKILSSFFVFIVLFGFFVPFSTVNAQVGTCKYFPRGEEQQETIPNVTRQECLRDYESGDWTENRAASTDTQNPRTSAAEIAAAEKKGEPKPDGCDLFAGMTGWFWCILNLIGGFALTITSFILWLAGVLLNFVLQVTIVDMSENLKGMVGINIAWKVLRDLMNIAFIFLLVWEGIKLILHMGDTTYVKKFIGMIVLASLLINFSLFFTKVMIDASNIATIGLYNSIITDSKTLIEYEPGKAIDDREVEGLASAFMSVLSLTQVYSAENFSNALTGNGSAYFITQLMGSVLFVITSFVFFAVSMMFIIRYITLLVLLMLSPIAYMGMALSQMQGYSTQWWTVFKNQLIFPPVYMLMTWVVLTLMTSAGFTGDPAESAKIPSMVNLIFNFVIVIGLVIFSLITAKQTATAGSSLIATATSNLTKFAGGAVMGSAAWASRRTVGAAASRLGESQRFQNWAGRSFIGEKALKATRATASGSFDVRNSRAVGAIAGQTGVDLGKGQVGGFTKILSDKTESKEKFGQSLRGDAAKEQYAARISGGLLTRGGSSSSTRSVFGVMGRSNRIVASKVLNDQLTPLQTQETNLQNRESQLSQQLVNLTNEEAAITAILPASRTPAQDARLIVLGGGVAVRGSIANINDQLTTTQTHLANATTEIGRIRGLINTNGLTNTNPSGTVTNPVTGGTRQRRADEQRY